MDILAELTRRLPRLRRVARMLVGNQETGDDLVTLVLERLSRQRIHTQGESAEVIVWRSLFEVATGEIARIPIANTETLIGEFGIIVTELEGLPTDFIAELTRHPPDLVATLMADAQAAQSGGPVTRVMIIEDEPFVAADIASIIESLGHQVVAKVATRRDAVAFATQHELELVLTDVQLAEGSSGIDAVDEILTLQELPVIYVTAFPERLLTGQRQEPTFLIEKPFTTQSVVSVVKRALHIRVNVGHSKPDGVSL